MNTVMRIADSTRSKTTTLAFLLFSIWTLVSTTSGADAAEVTERGTVSLAGVDVLTPEGLRLANWRIQHMAQRLCLQIVNIDERDAAACVGKAVADAQRKLDTVIQARLAERQAHAVASASKR